MKKVNVLGLLISMLIAHTAAASSSHKIAVCTLQETVVGADSKEVYYPPVTLKSFQVDKDDCADGTCKGNDINYSSTRFPNLEINVEADTFGSLHLTLVDHGDLTKADGALGATRMQANGKESVSAVYSSQRGNSYPLTGPSVMISCYFK